MAKKICLVLGAGGARGVAHVGVLQAFEEKGIKPDCIIGCSMGSVVGACYSKGMKPNELVKIAENLKMSDIADLSIFPLNKTSLLKSIKLRSTLTKYIGDVKFEDLEIPFSCVAVDVVNGESVLLNKGLVEPAVRASSAIPLVFKPVEIDGKVLVDGAVYVRLPLKEAKEAKCDITIVVDVLGGLQPYKPSNNIIGQGLRVVEVNDCYITERNLKKYKPDVLIRPDLEDMSQYKVERLLFAYERGYEAGLKAVRKIKRLLNKK